MPGEPADPLAKRRMELVLMGHSFAHKCAAQVLCLVVIVTVNFLLPRVMPGDPVLMLTGVEIESSGERYAELAEKTGLNDPLWKQFGRYIRGLGAGDLGYSFHHNDTVVRVIGERLPATLQITIPAVVFSSLLALVLGCTAGSMRNSPADTVISALIIVIHALPSFLLAMVLVFVGAFSFRLFPLGSLNSVVPPPGILGVFLDRLYHLVLPVLTLSLVSMPGKYFLLRNMVAASLDEKYVIYARSRGLSRMAVTYRHILRNASAPFITMIGLNLGFVLSGSMVIEHVFSIRGMGSLMYHAALARDFPVLQGCLVVSALMVVVAGLAADVVCFCIDPRLRRAGIGRLSLRGRFPVGAAHE